MQMLYDSDAYIVVHINAHDAGEGNAHNKGKPARHGFEIVHKAENREIYLDGDWAAVFQRQIQVWQEKTPTQEEVEKKLEQFTRLGHLPLRSH